MKHLFCFGDILIDMEMYKEAVNVYQDALKYNPYSYDLNYNLGIAYTMLNDFQSAKIAYEKAADINNLAYALKYDLAEIALIYKEIEEAEKKFLEAVLSLKRLDSDNLEIYYNGDKNIASFRIECFKTENKVVKNVGMYTPDFLVIRRDNKKKIDKVLIIETKGKGYIDQEEFKDRRNYVENEFIKFNNKKFGYKKFDYLVVDDGLEKDKIKSEVNKKLHEFFEEEK